MIETSYLLGNEANASHLKKSIGQYQAGKAKKRELLKDE
jgi:antitoxin YefM